MSQGASSNSFDHNRRKGKRKTNITRYLRMESVFQLFQDQDQFSLKRRELHGNRVGRTSSWKALPTKRQGAASCCFIDGALSRAERWRSADAGPDLKKVLAAVSESLASTSVDRRWRGDRPAGVFEQDEKSWHFLRLSSRGRGRRITILAPEKRGRSGLWYRPVENLHYVAFWWFGWRMSIW